MPWRIYQVMPTPELWLGLQQRLLIGMQAPF